MLPPNPLLRLLAGRPAAAAPQPPGQRIGYFGPGGGGIVTIPPRPVDPPISMIPGLHGSPPPPIAGGAPPGIAPAPAPAPAPPGHGLNAHELAGLGLNGPAFNLWVNRHPAAVEHGDIPGWVAAAGAASRRQPSLADAAAAGGPAAALAAQAHQMHEEPGGGLSPFPVPTVQPRRRMISPLAQAAVGY